MAKSRFQLPACEDDLWHQVVRALLGQRHADEAQAEDHVRLLEELAFHRVFCGRPLSYAFAKKTATWLAETEELEAPGTQARRWLAEVQGWELLIQRGRGNEAAYEFAIPTLAEYFAARHLAARWAQGEGRYVRWIRVRRPEWWRGTRLRCPNPNCGALLPPFRELLRQTEYEETLLLLVGLVREEQKEEQLLAGMVGELNLTLREAERCWHGDLALALTASARVGRQVTLTFEVLERCRHGHDAPAAAVVGRLVRHPDHELLYLPTAEALQRARVEAVRAGIVTPLIAALRDPKPVVRCRAADALGRLKIKNERAVEALIAALRDPKIEVGLRAAGVLGKIGDERAVEPLIAALRDPNSGINWQAAYALGQIGDKRASEPLIAVLADPAEWVRSWAAFALGEIGDGRAVEPLIVALCDPHKSVRFRAAQALGQIRDGQAVQPLIAALCDPVSDVRKSAAIALCKIPDGRAIPVLQKLRTGDPAPEVRDAAGVALAAIEGRSRARTA
jgi:HEAT repeat protein